MKPQEFSSSELSREKGRIKLFLESLGINRVFGYRHGFGVRIGRFMNSLKEEGRISHFDVRYYHIHPDSEFIVKWSEPSIVGSGKDDLAKNNEIYKYKLILLTSGIVAEDNNMSNLKENTNERRGILF